MDYLVVDERVGNGELEATFGDGRKRVLVKMNMHNTRSSSAHGRGDWSRSRWCIALCMVVAMVGRLQLCSRGRKLCMKK